MKRTIKLTDKVTVGDYLIEYANFNILINKGGSLVKCLDVKKDFNEHDYKRFIEKFENSYSNKT